MCLQAIADVEQKGRVVSSLESGGREIVDISMEQMHEFAGNMLQLAGGDGAVLAMSATAESVLDEDQRRVLSSCSRIISSPIGTIEKCSGGSVRCMLAEIHLPSMD